MTDPDELLTHRDLAQLLDVPEKSLHAYRIPHARIGKQKIYLRGDVLEWLKARRDAR